MCLTASVHRVSARLLVIRHQPSCPPGWFGEWIEDAGVEVVVLAADEGEDVPASLDGFDGLLVLGGSMGANDDRLHPWLTATKALVAGTVRAGEPFLGICLGHQLAGAALGGRVEVNVHGHSTGVTPFRPTPEAALDPLLAGVAAGTLTVQWNNDVVTVLPPDAVRLATAPDGTVQAARYGDRAWGVQFHPEASALIFRGWTVDRPVEEQRDYDGVDTAGAVAQVTAHEAVLRQGWEPVARRFAAVVQDFGQRARQAGTR